jgi:MoaA/NifB/PqqE/SkfB family radical SAM enzyme
MNIYYLQKANKIIKSDFLKNIVIWMFHIFNKRYLIVYFDPILGCNLRCKACYFSNDDKRKELKGTFKEEDLPLIANAIFSRTLKLQIGCGAEPTLFQHNSDLIRLAKEMGISYISLTTNANLLNKEEVINLLDAGLDELTISLHGIVQETYENLMPNASYLKLLEVINLISNFKSSYPSLKLRLNYTINNLNIAELNQFFSVFGNFSIDILQIRMLRNIGGEIRNVDKNDSFNTNLKQTLDFLNIECKERNITFIPPDNFIIGNDDNESNNITSATYCYISPKVFWRQDFDWRNETFYQYNKRTTYSLKLFKNIFNKSALDN